jgi:hypothetical protein
MVVELVPIFSAKDKNFKCRRIKCSRELSYLKIIPEYRREEVS